MGDADRSTGHFLGSSIDMISGSISVPANSHENTTATISSVVASQYRIYGDIATEQT
jgi:hypothetical protein